MARGSEWGDAGGFAQVYTAQLARAADEAETTRRKRRKSLMKFLWQLYAIIAKEFAVEWRTKETLSAMLVFSLLVLVIFNFAFDLQGIDIKVIGPGILWVAFSFSGILGLGRSFARRA